MAYCTRSDIEDRYGVTNVARWADLDNDQSSVKITARIARAIAVAEAHVDAVLRTSQFSHALPVAYGSSTTPVLVTDIAARLAGYWLYTARGTKDYDSKGEAVNRLTLERREALEMLDAIASGKIKTEALS